MYSLGFTVRAKAPSQMARTNKAFSEGVHYWEIIRPISLSTLCKYRTFDLRIFLFVEYHKLCLCAFGSQNARHIKAWLTHQAK
jgi:hypothetical protein